MGILTRKTFRVALVAGAVATSVVLPRVAARVAPGEPPVHEIRLIVRDMAYHFGDDPAINPTLRVRAGERVRLILTNTDAGMSHDFVIPDLKVATRLLKGKDSETIEFTAPASAGDRTYNCTPHAETMRGTIAVE
ncbi:MAG TPA: cupredoxin domain-containing protein [Vicinamibacterales bacterium]|jgi:plastocyanin|nr:cupredoxin domain-containing protein [Vicinamibacterales bacterium]